jgi:hypothetical protein
MREASLDTRLATEHYQAPLTDLSVTYEGKCLCDSVACPNGSCATSGQCYIVASIFPALFYSISITVVLPSDSRPNKLTFQLNRL